MSKDKDVFRDSVQRLLDILNEAPHERRGHGLQAIQNIDRFAGDLRRKIGDAKREHALTQGQVEALKARIHEQEDKLTAKQEEIEAQRRRADRLIRDINDLHQQLKRKVGSGRDNIFVYLHAKCLECSLHFSLLTERPEQHSYESMRCPECGQHSGQFMLWIAHGKGWIWENHSKEAQRVLGAVPPTYLARLTEKQRRQWMAEDMLRGMDMGVIEVEVSEE